MKCPKCGSSQTQLMKRGFNSSDACCGAICLGPLGLLCGNVGGNKINVHCSRCGHKFMNTTLKNFDDKLKKFWSNLFDSKRKRNVKSNNSLLKKKNKNSENIFKQKIFGFFAWFFSIVFILTGLGILSSSIVGGILGLIAGIILSPPFLKFLEKKKFILMSWMRIGLSIILIIIAISIS